MVKNITNAITWVFRLAPQMVITEMVLSILLAIAMPVQLKLTENVINCVSDYVAGTVSFSGVVVKVGCFAALLVAQVVLGHFIDSIYIELKRQMNHKLSAEIIAKLQKIKYQNFENDGVYDIINRIKEEPAEKISGLFHGITVVLSYFVELVCIACLLAEIRMMFGLAYAGILLFIVGMNFRSMYKMNSMFYELSPSERRLSYFEKLVMEKSSLYELRIYGAENRILSKISDENKKVFSERLKTTVSAQKYCFLSNIGTTLWIVAIMGFMLQAFQNGTVTAGLMVALLSMVGRILSSTESVSYEISGLAQNAFIASCLNDFFALEDEKCGEARLEETTVHKIEFDHVSFRYSEKDPYVLEDISITMTSRENIALVGCNGAGKTTFILLLTGLLEPTEGQILIDGIPISGLAEDSRKALFSVVFQDYGKYALSIRENVALGAVERMDDSADIYRALRMAEAEGDFPELDRTAGKLDDHGTDLSGGQWQKLAIARAFFPNRQFFILDEPTASLDAKAEDALYRNLKTKLQDKGCIFITHRLPGAIMSDRIFVMDGGRIAETGTHAELLVCNGIYARMYHAQADSYEM